MISFHSLEDRLVKQGMRNHAKGCECPPEFPVCVCRKKPVMKVLTRKAVMPTEAEMSRNPMSRSARMRAAERI